MKKIFWFFLLIIITDGYAVYSLANHEKNLVAVCISQIIMMAFIVYDVIKTEKVKK